MNETLKELVLALKERSDLNKKIDGIKDKLVTEISPYVIGDIVPVMGYAHQGKKCRITSISIRNMDFGDAIDLYVKGVVLKKDGSDSQNTVDWHSYNDPKLEEAINKITNKITK